MEENKSIPATKPDFDHAAAGEDSKVIPFARPNQPAQQQVQEGCPMQELRKRQAALQRG